MLGGGSSAQGKQGHASSNRGADRQLLEIASVTFRRWAGAGIGETRLDRVEALLHIRGLHSRWGHIQEVIVQSFRAKQGTAMAAAPEPPLSELLWTVAVARLLLGPQVLLLLLLVQQRATSQQQAALHLEDAVHTACSLPLLA
jgi:FO synthase